MWLRAALLLVLSASWLLPASASASDPPLEEARRHYELAEFSEALEDLSRAERSTDLSAPDLHDLLALRATIHFARRDEPAYRAELRALAGIAPDYRLDPELPPQLLAVWEEVRSAAEPLRLRVVVIQQEGTVRVEAQLEGDGQEAVRGGPAVFARRRGEAWRSGVEGAVQLEGVEPGIVEYYVTAPGLGGVTVAREGSAEAPLSLWLGATASPDSGERDWLPWILAGSAGAIAVGLAIALGVVASQ